MLGRLRKMKKAISLILILITISCRGVGSFGWQLPIKLGESKARVYEKLGSPSHIVGENIHWFENSGMTVKYDPSGNVSEITIHGSWNALFLTYQGPIIFGIKVTDNFQKLVRTFGEPISSEVEYPGSSQSVHKWRKSPFIIEAEIWTKEYIDSGRISPINSIASIQISRAIGGE